MSKENSTLYGGESVEVAAARKYAQANGLPDPYRAYALQRVNAKVRDIEWGFTFAGWWTIWQPYFHMRGKGKNFLCMARENDEGPYAPGNVYLTTLLGNLADHKKSAKAIEAKRLTKERNEVAFAKSNSGSKYKMANAMSHLTFKIYNSSKSTCNYSDEVLEY